MFVLHHDLLRLFWFCNHRCTCSRDITASKNAANIGKSVRLQGGAPPGNICVTNSAQLLMQPLGHKMGDLLGPERARLNNIRAPRRNDRSETRPAVPAHLRPRILSYDLRPVPVVDYM